MIRPSRIIYAGGGPYLRRWHLIPRNRWFNVYLHHFLASDDVRALHDHPWPSLSLMLAGEMGEIYRLCRGEGVAAFSFRQFRPGQLVYRPADFSHRIVIPEGKTAWTLFLTGRRVRRWGFWCPGGWKYWRDFSNDGGCGENDV